MSAEFNAEISIMDTYAGDLHLVMPSFWPETRYT